MRTSFFDKKNIPRRQWFVIDANDMVLGRLSSKIAYILQGKNKEYYTPHSDIGDFIVVINAEKVCLTKKKALNKVYWRHTGYPGGIKKTSFVDLLEKYPEKVIFNAVRRMLPKNKLAKKMLHKLKVYSSNEHPHAAQTPKPIKI